MELMEALKTRRTVRSYTSQPVDKKTIEALIQAAVLAPSASNNQPWAFGVIQGADALKRYSDRAKVVIMHDINTNPNSPLAQYRDMFADPKTNIFYGAPALIIMYARSQDGAPLPWGNEGCAMAAENLMLAAHAMGLGTVWVGCSHGFFSSEEVMKELDVPAGYTLIAPLLVGHPSGETEATPREAPQILFWK